MSAGLVYLYVVLCDGPGCAVDHRFPMPDWQTCRAAAASFRYQAPANTTENESAVAVFCAGPEQSRGGDGKWYVRATGTP